MSRPVGGVIVPAGEEVIHDDPTIVPKEEQFTDLLTAFPVTSTAQEVVIAGVRPALLTYLGRLSPAL